MDDLLTGQMSISDDDCRIARSDTVLAAVPLFHAMGWNLPFVCASVGAKMVMPGPYLQPEPLAHTIAQHQVTWSAGVPTIWMDLARYLASNGSPSDVKSLRRIISGGTQVPLALVREYREVYDVEMAQGWGMTEILPGATVTGPDESSWSEEETWRRRTLAGRVSPLYELRVIDPDTGAALPHDGESAGEIQVRGPIVASESLGSPGGGSQTPTTLSTRSRARARESSTRNC